MKKLLLPVLLSTVTVAANAQAQYRTAEGGGEYKHQSAECVSDAQRAGIQQMLNENRKALIEKGILSDNAQRKTTAVKFDWPLKQAPGFKYNEVYAISNYVDHNVNYPGQIQDWNCGTRSYDLASGYNHSGMDIYLWPFDINIMDRNQAQIVAAAPGVITAKTDGNFDKNCAMGGSGTWNAVYVEHADGTVAWYGHMKKGSLTTKNVGDAVATGDVLGTVGSSGSSTGPHLHFEVHNAANDVLDPYNGTCNVSPSMWNTQKPYYEPTINAVLTHDAAPKFNACPQAHATNEKDVFGVGANTIVFAGYFHDQQAGQNTTYSILRPDGTLFDTWSHSSPTTYTSSYWYWTRTIPATEQVGTWKFEAFYNSKKVTHEFYRNFPADVSSIAAGDAIQVYPNPAKDMLYIKAQHNIERVALYNTVGQSVYTNKTYNNTGISISHLPDGMYYLHATINGQEVQQKIIINK